MFPSAKTFVGALTVLMATACAAPAASAESRVRHGEGLIADAHAGPSGGAAPSPGSGSLEWRFNAGSSLPAAPVVGADGTVYAGTGDGALQAVTPEGALRWSFTLEGAVATSPVIDVAGRILVATEASRLYAFWPSGERAWLLHVRSHFATDLVLSPAFGVLVGATDGSVWAFSDQGGALWHTDVGAPLSSVLGVSGRRIVTATSAGSAWLFDGAVKRFSAPLGAAPRGAPVVYEDGSAVVLAGSSLVRLDASGSVAWRRERVSFLGADRGTLLVVEGPRGPTASDAEGTFFARVGADGRTLRTVRLPGRATSAPIASERAVLVSGDTGDLWTILADGSVVTTRIGGGALHRPVLDAPRRRVLVASGSGAITMLEMGP
jgi:outer membrane protein assembly factor BamB